MTDTTETDPHDATEPTTERSGFGRRPLLRAVGAGAALSFGTGVAAADRDDPRPPRTAPRQPRIDPNYGYATPDADEVPENLAPDHVVELHTREPAPAEHGPIFHFEPTGLAVEAGDIVQFTYTSPDHTISAYHPTRGFQRRIPVDAPPFSSPVVGVGGAWLYRFDVAGLYDVYCAPHHILGMTMRIVVGDLPEADVPDYEDTFEGSEDPPLLAPFSTEFLEAELENFSGEGENRNAQWVWLTPREVLDASALDPANVQADDGRVPFDDVLADIDRIGGGGGHE